MTRTTTGTTGTTIDPGSAPERRRPGLSVRLRITATSAILVLLTVTGAGLIVYLVEAERLEQRGIEAVEQELSEFTRFASPDDGSVPPRFGSLEEMLRQFMQRNVPNEHELLVGWAGDRPVVQSPRSDPLVGMAEFREAVEPLVVSGGSTRVNLRDSEVLVTAQPVTRGDERGALLVVLQLDAELAELRETMVTYAIVTGLSLLIVTAVAFWQSGRLLAPLRTLRRTAEEISETDLSRRLPVRGNDDITDLTRTVNGMLARLEAAFAGQRQFLDDAGHELRTPLTVLRGHLEVLDTGNPEDVAETRQLLLEEIDRMSRLVKDLILLAKSDRPDFLRQGPVDLETLTEDLLVKARALGERDWQLDAVGVGTLQADEQRLTQAVLQLCDNAVKHTEPGDVVAIGSARDTTEVRLWVRDTGPGIPPSDRELVFERFGRSRVREGDEGFGLGLSIVRAIAEAHAGDVAVDAEWAGGAKLVLRLPATGSTGPRPHPDDTLTMEVPVWPAS